MPKPKRHHYVPQFFLRQFKARNGKNRIWVFDKKKHEIRLQAIKECAHESRFYEHSDLAQVGIDLEHQFAEFEGKLAPILAAIVRSRSLLSVTKESRTAILDFVLVQLFRTRATREFAKQGSVKFSNIGISEETSKKFSLAVLLRDFEKYRRSCSNHIVTLREAVVPETFLLGDAVTLIVRTVEGPKDSLRAILPLATICVPISPTLALMFFPAEREVDLADAGEWYVPELRVLTEAQPAAPGDIASINKMSIIASNRFVFGETNDFNQCFEVLKTYPDAEFGPVGDWRE